MLPIPMPNNKLAGATVVASVYLTDERALLLMLNENPPFFTVTEYSLGNGSFIPIATTENIVPAVREYEQNGGDY